MSAARHAAPAHVVEGQRTVPFVAWFVTSDDRGEWPLGMSICRVEGFPRDGAIRVSVAEGAFGFSDAYDVPAEDVFATTHDATIALLLRMGFDGEAAALRAALNGVPMGLALWLLLLAMLP